MKNNHRIVFMLLALFIIVSLSGCGKSASSGAPSPNSEKQDSSGLPSPTSEGNPVKNAVPIKGVEAGADINRDIVICQAVDMISFDPISTSDTPNSYVIHSVYDRLFFGDENDVGQPEMCKSFEMISDEEWHFTIYDNVYDHEGNHVTAEDVVYCLKRAQEGTSIGALFSPVKEIDKIDDYTFSIKTDGPYPALPTALSHQATSIVPINYCRKAEASNDWSKPVGTGRYLFKERAIGDSITFVRNDNYWNQNDPALNKSLTIKIIPEGSARTIAVETGACDLNVAFDTVDYERATNSPSLQLWQHDSAKVWHLGFDTTHKWLSNKLVRQAIQFAVNKEDCLEVGHNGQGRVIYNCSTFAPTVLGYIENPGGLYRYDVEKAKELMKKADCPGFEAQIVVFLDDTERIAVLLQSQLAEIGIKLSIRRIESSVFASMIANHECPFFITSWGCYQDPDLFLARRFTKVGIGGVNRGWYLNPVIDPLIVEGRSSFDVDKRAGVYKKIQEIMAEDAVECDLYVSKIFALSAKETKGIELNTDTPMCYYKVHY